MANTNKNNKMIPNEAIGALADAFGKSFTTIKRWVDSGDVRLTTDTAKKVLKKKCPEAMALIQN